MPFFMAFRLVESAWKWGLNAGGESAKSHGFFGAQVVIAKWFTVGFWRMIYAEIGAKVAFMELGFKGRGLGGSQVLIAAGVGRGRELGRIDVSGD